MGIGELSYSFDPWKGSINNLYAELAIGYGTSTTTINEITSQGSVWAIPIVRVGIQNNSFKNISWLFEAVFESLTAQEIYEDGDQQTTNITNGKVGIGIKF